VVAEGEGAFDDPLTAVVPAITGESEVIVASVAGPAVFTPSSVVASGVGIGADDCGGARVAASTFAFA